MGVLRYIKMTFIDDIKKSVLYIAVMVFSIIIIFNTFNIIFNEQIVAYRSKEYMDMSKLVFIILAVSIMFIAFANSYYLEDKFKEYAVITLSGKSVGEICIIVVIRNFIVTAISIVIGCLLGAITSVFVLNGISKLVGVNINGNYISVEALILTTVIIFTELESVFLINTGSIYKKSINELVNRKKRAYIPDNRRVKINPIIYIIIYLLPLAVAVIPTSPEERIKNISFAIIIGIFGIQGIIRYVIPGVINNYRNGKKIADKCKLIIASNLFFSIQKSIVLTLFLVVSSVLTISTAGQYRMGTVVNTMSLACYILIIGIMSITVVYKFLIEAKSRKENFEQLKLLGYTKREIKKIIQTEVVVYYAIIILLALLYILIVALGSAMAGLMSIKLAIVVVMEYIIIFLTTAMVSLGEYKKIALLN
ncbi:FtsX-like permease family protein [Clostridium cibarium]|uniref:ABC3 transporter permease C-terminal domain-containing protein n=1 Tax=Clostridium cibarium TaxID=2762247 RepID=A0ABR8PWM5_9CLOT|nr:FtsX-like permease family protein [Clostridium cibarium]MBD7912576.1 hypothetical protein [Clostridium cibarium]